MRGVRDVLLRGEERGVEIALPELSEEERGDAIAIKTGVENNIETLQNAFPPRSRFPDALSKRHTRIFET